MSRILILSFLLLASPSSLAATCGVMKTQAEAETAGGAITLYAGEVLPVKSKNKTRSLYNVMVGEQKVGVPRAAVKLISGIQCAPRFLVAARTVPAHSLPNGEGELSEIAVGTAFTAISETRAGGEPWVRVAMGESTYWLAKGDVPSGAGAGAPMAASAPARAMWMQNWQFGIEAGMFSALSNRPYEGLVTTIPNSADVGALQDPIVTSVSKGEGSVIRIFAERPVWKLVEGRLGLGYRSEAYSYDYKSNPSLGPVRLDQLSGASRDISLKRFQFDFGAGLRHHRGKFSWSYGFQLAALYTSGADHTIDTMVPSGVFFKNTPSKVTAGPSTLEMEYWLRLDGRWRGITTFLGANADGAFMYGLGYAW